MEIKLYDDDATDEEIQKALEKFMKTNDYFEASNWVVTKKDGKFISTCCPQCAVGIYNTLKDWQKDHSVYPDQYQWTEVEGE